MTRTNGNVRLASVGDPPVGDDTPAVRLHGIRKQFGQEIALDGYELDVPRRSVHRLSGLDERGTTTVLDMLAGLVPPDEGSVEVFGVDVWQEPVAIDELVAVLPEDDAAPEAVTGQDWLVCAGMGRGLDDAERRAADLLEECGLGQSAVARVGAYSPGMLRRLALAAATVHRPPLLVLSHPYDGLDPFSAAMIRSMLRRYVASGGTVVYTESAGGAPRKRGSRAATRR